MTPRTDALQATLTVARKDTKETIGELQRTLDHARQLETELSASTAALAETRSALRQIAEYGDGLSYDKWAPVNMKEIASAALAASNPNHP